MANVIIKSDERRAMEQQVAASFGVRPGDSSGREAAECIAVRSREAYAKLRRMEDKK